MKFFVGLVLLLLLLLLLGCGSLPPEVCDRYEAEHARISAALATAEGLLALCTGSDCDRVRAVIAGLRATLGELAQLCRSREDSDAFTNLNLAIVRQNLGIYEREVAFLQAHLKKGG